MMTQRTAEATSSPVYFWKDHGKYGFLCQWYLSAFSAPPHPSSTNQDTMVFSSTEQYMMYHKAMTFRDHRIAAQIMRVTDPRQQKAKGRQVRGFDDKEWNEVKEKIVEDGNWWKFTAATDQANGLELKRLLVQTEPRLLVEASPFDSIWGIGFDAASAGSNHAHWGLNLLGIALMKVRHRIMEGNVKATDRIEPEKGEAKNSASD